MIGFIGVPVILCSKITSVLKILQGPSELYLIITKSKRIQGFKLIMLESLQARFIRNRNMNLKFIMGTEEG